MRPLFRGLAVLLLALPSPGLGGGGETVLWIDLAPEATVRGLVLRIGDVARIDALDAEALDALRRVSLGRTPPPGERVLLTRESLARSIAAALPMRHRISFRGAEAVSVRTGTRTVPGSDILTLARKRVAAELRGIEHRLILPADEPDLVLPEPRESLAVAVEPAGPSSFAGPVPLHVVAVVDGTEAARRPLVVRIERRGTILVAARGLRPGQSPGPDDVELREGDLGSAGAGVVTSLESLSGLRARRALRRGDVLRSADFAPPPVVRRGDPVTILLERGSLSITAAGEARAEGAPGEAIPVLNAGSRRIVRAVVRDSRTVIAVPEESRP